MRSNCRQFAFDSNTFIRSHETFSLSPLRSSRVEGGRVYTKHNGIWHWQRLHRKQVTITYCLFCIAWHFPADGSRNSCGLPRSVVSCAESGDRRTNDLPDEALQWEVHRAIEQLARTIRSTAPRLCLDGGTTTICSWKAERQTSAKPCTG
jgi:hypothetical protein